MPRKKPVLGYSSMTAAVMDMRERGMGNRAIANKLGITPKTAAGLLESGLRTAEARSRRANLVIPAVLVKTLQPHADRRGITPGKLALRILAAIASDKLVDAVLDDQPASRGEAA